VHAADARASAFLFRVLNRFLPGPEVGARTPLYLAKAPELEGVTGRYFEKGAEKAPSRLARDEALAKDLWARLEKAIAACGTRVRAGQAKAGRIRHLGISIGKNDDVDLLRNDHPLAVIGV
jgi:hypothetical protein